MTTRLRQLHEHPAIIAGAQTASGRVLIWFAAMTLLVVHDVNALMPAAFTLVLLFPDRRRGLLMLAAFGLLAGRFLPRPVFDLAGWPESLGAIETARWLRFLFSTAVATTAILGLVIAAIRFDRLPAVVRRFPLLTLHLLLWPSLLLGSLPYLQVFALAPFILWRAAYLFKAAAAGKTAGTSLKDHLFYMVPVFGGTNTPFGKGPDYLGRSEATSPESIARAQLAGINLLGLALIWKIVLAAMSAVIYGRVDTPFAASLSSWSFALPSLADLLHAASNPAAVTGWISVYLELVRAILELAIWGHIIVGSLRLLGFNVFRNTYKPLYAQSIVEFWNRFYFYFKELLVQFFFYPVFYRNAWAGPGLRLFLAISAAAFFGNVYYHVLREKALLYAGDLSGFMMFWNSRLVYCALLVLGIWLSMLRQQERRKRAMGAAGLSKLRAIAGVWTFYGLIHVWLVAPYDVSVGRRLDFFLSLIGL